MKKTIFIFILMSMFIFMPSTVFASGDILVSPDTLTIEVGSSKTFTITATNTIGDVTITSSNSSVAKVSINEWTTGMVDEGETKSETVTVTALSVGNAKITLNLDAASFDGDDLSGQTRVIDVNVVNTPTPIIEKNPTNSESDKSNNNKLKKLSVRGYELVKVNENNYTLTVSNNVNSIDIEASAEDEKSTITGIGKHDLRIGSNTILVIITSEAGTKNEIKVNITRKSDFYLEDLDEVLRNNSIRDITITKDSILSSLELTKIKNSKKTLNLNYYDENNKLIYAWTLNGKEIKDYDTFKTNIKFNSTNKTISELSNYADGIYISMADGSALPTGTKIKLFIGNKYADDNKVNVYYFNKGQNKFETIKEKLAVTDGYIEFEVDKGSEYFITMSNIYEAKKIESSPNSNKRIVVIVFMVLIIIVLLVAIIYFAKRKK